jgi:hypothetical protein
MILHRVIPIMILCSCVSPLAPAQGVFPNQSPLALPGTVAHAQDINKAVLPITVFKFVGLATKSEFGTGFCLDPQCRFIGTNYHVAAMARPRKIKGERVLQQYLATGPDDEGATVNYGASMGLMKYTPSRDLAILELRRPLRDHHGVAFSLDDLETGQEIDIYAYPMESINPFRSLLKFHGTFKGQTTTGLLAFDYSLSANKAILPGASGGIVVDSKTQQIVGILNEIERNGEAIALAVPVQALADFVSKVEPFLAQSIFPPTKEISPISADLFPKFEPPSPVGVLQYRPEEPAEVSMLRIKAQLLADSIRNFIAVQTFAWGSGNKEPAAMAAYEVRVLDGYQYFRKYPDGKKEFQDVPFPPLNTVIVSGGEWSELPAMVGTKRRLKIHQAADVVVNERRMKVFQYRADIEDGLCGWRSNLDFGFFAISRSVIVACYGEVWTDEESNILRISEHLELTGKWKHYQAVVTYGSLQLRDNTPRLVPLSISAQAENNKKIYWCRGRFMNYQVFSSRVKLTGSGFRE